VSRFKPQSFRPVQAIQQPEVPSIRVAVCMPCRDQVDVGFAHDLTRMVGSTVGTYGNIEIQTLFDRGTVISSQRNNLVKAARKYGAQFLLWLDTDMRFPADTLIRLLRHEKPIVGANYPTRRLPVTTVTFADPKLVDPKDRVYTFPESTGLEPVGATGMGCLLVQASVYDDLVEPWHNFRWDEAAKEFSGEDIWFCRLARAKGYEVLIDHDLSKQVQHIGVFAFKHEHALAHREMAQTMMEAEAVAAVEA
jgi:hypothetical protein